MKCRIPFILVAALLLAAGAPEPQPAGKGVDLPEGVTHVALPPGAVTWENVKTQRGMTVRATVGKTVVEGQRLFFGDGKLAMQIEATKGGMHFIHFAGSQGPNHGSHRTLDFSVKKGILIDGVHTYEPGAALYLEPDHPLPGDLKPGSVYVTTPSVAFALKAWPWSPHDQKAKGIQPPAKVELQGVLVHRRAPRNEGVVWLAKVGDDGYELDFSGFKPPPSEAALRGLGRWTVLVTGALQLPHLGRTRGKLESTPLVTVSSLTRAEGQPYAKAELRGKMISARAPHDRSIVWLVEVNSDDYELDLSGLKPALEEDDLLKLNRRTVLVAGTLELPHQGTTSRGKSLQNVPLVAVSSFKDMEKE